MKPILTFILLMTFIFTLTSESSAQPPWKEQMKRQQEFERENAKRFREINREQQKRAEEIFRERGKAQAEFERESFKNYAEQQREAAKWQTEQQREQLKGWEEQQRFYAEQQREQFQDQREWQRDRREFDRDFQRGPQFGGGGYGYGFQQPAPGVYQPIPVGPQGGGYMSPPFQNGAGGVVYGGGNGGFPQGGHVVQHSYQGPGQFPQAQRQVILPPASQAPQLGSVIISEPILGAPNGPNLNGPQGHSVLQPGIHAPQFPSVPPINYGPAQR